MFGYELVDTLCVFCANELNILSSKKKIEFLRPLEAAMSKRNGLPLLKLLVRNKSDADASNFISMVSAIKKSQKVRVLVGGIWCTWIHSVHIVC